ncbi:uncharacterized protein BDR25DRAFT_354421 [Lindgomyces ingoldianus]|uniref:Uncharacterized protein n=1 Tax=Lindgomyces ingoldianus TaxID=673940 RepID=A0ACB6QYI7_9PLEO|nr:uncharacterized protein BDR25DRAFT_354421 [Lindgomyces ingoldianus]KAF2471157.1 hypothetical protein BDR25DRAFT_354421 [Lindgomyces ingoldianus]
MDKAGLPESLGGIRAKSLLPRTLFKLEWSIQPSRIAIISFRSLVLRSGDLLSIESDSKHSFLRCDSVKNHGDLSGLVPVKRPSKPRCGPNSSSQKIATSSFNFTYGARKYVLSCLSGFVANTVAILTSQHDNLLTMKSDPTSEPPQLEWSYWNNATKDTITCSIFTGPGARGAYMDPERAEINFMEATGNGNILYVAALYSLKVIEELASAKGSIVLKGPQAISQQLRS